MAREEGKVNASLEAWLRVRPPGVEVAECLVETGFNGALVPPRAVVTHLGLDILGGDCIYGAAGAWRRRPPEGNQPAGRKKPAY